MQRVVVVGVVVGVMGGFAARRVYWLGDVCRAGE